MGWFIEVHHLVVNPNQLLMLSRLYIKSSMLRGSTSMRYFFALHVFNIGRMMPDPWYMIEIESLCK